MRLLLLLLLSSPALAQDDARWHRVVGLLEYLEGDYANALATGDEAELEEQRGFSDEVIKQLLAAGDEGAPYLERARSLEAAIVAGKPADEVTPQCGALARALAADKQLVQSPKHLPSLEQGKSTYDAMCAVCHGEDGRAQTPMAKTLEPAPADFTDEERMSTLTPYKVFNTTTFGIPGTGMAAFDSLPEETRWNLAFYVFTLRLPACEAPGAHVPVKQLATLTDVQLQQDHAATSLACLRRTIREESRDDSLSLAVRLLDEALARDKEGARDAARQLVVDAYLEGLEPVEPALRARDAALVSQLEAAFTRARLAAQSGDGFPEAVREVKSLLQRASTDTSASDFWAVLVATLLILLREGFEAIVVLGALLAVLKKMNAPHLVRVVHAGWISSLFAGALAFIFGRALLAGANREWMETVVSLTAVALLLYAALWLNARANISRHMQDVRGQLTQAVAGGSTWSLFFISFSSVGREALETALFLQGLAADSLPGVVWGTAAGLLLLLVLIIVVRTVGFRLPMKTLFTASTIALLATAVMLLGKGVHGLQEVDVLPLRPVPFVQLDALGIFPDAWSLAAQVLLAAACTLFLRFEKRLTTRA